jgi:hypothetical protein
MGEVVESHFGGPGLEEPEEPLPRWTAAARARAEAQMSRLALRVTLDQCWSSVHEAKAAVGGSQDARAEVDDAADTIQQLHRALMTRTTIGVALGMVMVRFSLDQDAAWAYLRRLSNHGNRRVADVALDIIHGRDGSA